VMRVMGEVNTVVLVAAGILVLGFWLRHRIKSR